MHVVEIDNSKIFQTHSYRIHLDNILYKSCVLGINAYIYLGLISSYFKACIMLHDKVKFFSLPKNLYDEALVCLLQY